MDTVGMTTRKSTGEMYDVFLREMYLFTASYIVADTVCTSFNEYDTLKAKAELYKNALEKITKHAYRGVVVQTAYEALEKAEGL